MPNQAYSDQNPGPQVERSNAERSNQGMSELNALIGLMFITSGAFEASLPDASNPSAIKLSGVLSGTIAALCAANSVLAIKYNARMKAVYFIIWVFTFSWVASNVEHTSVNNKKIQQIVSLSSIVVMIIESIKNYKPENLHANVLNFSFLALVASSASCQLSYLYYPHKNVLHWVQAILKIGAGITFMSAAMIQLIVDNPEPNDILSEPLLGHQDSIGSQQKIAYPAVQPPYLQPPSHQLAAPLPRPPAIAPTSAAPPSTAVPPPPAAPPVLTSTAVPPPPVTGLQSPAAPTSALPPPAAPPAPPVLTSTAVPPPPVTGLQSPAVPTSAPPPLPPAPTSVPAPKKEASVAVKEAFILGMLNEIIDKILEETVSKERTQP